MSIIDIIKNNAKASPDRMMMLSRGEERIYRLTWKELDDYSDKLAYWMDKNCKTKKPVIVYGHKHPVMVVCFLACVKSGRAYCPVDVNVPKARVEAIIDSVDPDLILTTEPLEIDSDNICLLDDIKKIISETKDVITEESYVKADDVFYIIFTSGSTGAPKGVQITRDCLDNFIRWAITLGNGIEDNKHYVFLNQAPFSFDLSVMDLYLCLYSGGTLFSLTKSQQSDMKMLMEALKKSKVNVWVSTPSFADICLSDPSFNDELMPELTDFLFCGEILTNKTVKRLQNRFPNSKIVNTYGPTESTCAITQVEIIEELNDNVSPLPVGRPKAGTWIRIMDDSGNILPDGEHGEIVIVGDTVGIGYFNNEEKNKLSFGTTMQDGVEYRYYRTGDEGYLKDGMLYYGGRIDLQVKLHGYRIELEDIESNLLKIPGIIQAVVIPKYRDGKVSSLAAGIVLDDSLSENDLPVDDIKSLLKKSLPEYMIPKKIKVLEDIPRTNNGKIDRKAVGELL